VGFDVVIGNPPYIRQEEFSALKPYLQSNYQTYAGTADLLVYFIELGMNLLRPGGVFNFIISNKFMRANFGKPLREWLGQYRILEILDFGDLPVFEEATTYPCTLQLHKSAPADGFFAANIAELDTADFGNYVQTLRFFSSQSALSAEGWNLSDTAVQQLLEKLKKTGIPLGEYVKGKIYRGVLTGLNEAFVIDEVVKNRLITEDPKSAEVIKPFLAGRDVKRYVPPRSDKFLIFFQKGWTIAALGKLPEEEAFQKLEKLYPAIAGHFLPFAEKGRKRADQGDYWWELRACDYYEEFEKAKIIFPDIAAQVEATYSNNPQFSVNTTYFIPCDDLFLLGLLNSQLD
jgi:adenine-specific DNA-methyltransferase